MYHPNVSLHSLNDQNLYEISIGTLKLKKKYPGIPPRRVGLTSSLATLSETKRPGDYYIQKLGNSSSNLPRVRRPASGISVTSSDTSKDSDDVSLLASSQFDPPDSRLSSMTMNTLYLTKNADNSISKPVSEKNTLAEEDVDQMSASILTITLENDVSASDLTDVIPNRMVKPKLRAMSTSSVMDLHLMVPLSKTRTVSSSFLLTRTKTKYYNPKEKKERQQLRKKVYDDFDNDDEILSNDLDLVFNVPVVKNFGEMYRYRHHSSSSMLSHNDLSMDDDNKYHPHSNMASMKPCPLPGRLNHSTLSVDTTLGSMPEHAPYNTLEEFAEEGNLFPFAHDNDGEISQNISEFYGQRSMSYSKLVKQSREAHMVYKLPNYIRSQSSIDDLTLMSPEKLEMIDQSRPINLPPKCASDKVKHNKEFKRVLSGFEINSKQQNGARRKLGELFILNQQVWFKLMITINDDKEFAGKLSYEKEKLRKVAWESLISEKFCFDFFMKVLTLNSAEGCSDQVKKNLAALETKYQSLSAQMKAMKDAEFDKVINLVLLRPVYVNFIREVSNRKDSEFDIDAFKANYKHLLYLKSYSDSGLKKHHEIFIIPMFLIFFQTQETFENICILIELFDKNVFSEEILGDLNKKLKNWKDLSGMSTSSMPYKILSKFDSLKEFEYLNSGSFFELLIQLNDKLPLSLSAPSTPIVSQGGFAQLTSAKQSAEFLEGANGNLATSSAESLADLNLSSIYYKSSSLSLVGIFLQLLVLYSNSPKSKKLNFLKMYQACLLTVFKFYHINWNSTGELVRGNQSIRLNHSSDEMMNLESFLDKWKEIFKKM